MAFTKFELLTSPSCEKIRILSILFLTTQRDLRKFPASTAVPVLAFPSSCLKVPSNTNKTVKELEDSVDFNDGEIADLKRDLRASEKSMDDISKQLLYQEHYSRRENLMFMGIAEINAMDGQGTQQEPENTKELVYKFMEEQMQISNPRGSIEFQRIHRVGKPKQDGPCPTIGRFLRYADREMVLHQARKTLKNKHFSVFEDIPKEKVAEQKV